MKEIHIMISTDELNTQRALGLVVRSHVTILISPRLGESTKDTMGLLKAVLNINTFRNKIIRCDITRRPIILQTTGQRMTIQGLRESAKIECEVIIECSMPDIWQSLLASTFAEYRLHVHVSSNFLEHS